VSDIAFAVLGNSFFIAFFSLFQAMTGDGWSGELHQSVL
jgi:hypothetical protein